MKTIAAFITLAVVSPFVFLTDIGKNIDDFILFAALIFSFLSLARSILRKNTVPLRIVKFVCVLLFFCTHYLLDAYRASIDLDAQRFLMEFELLTAATYMAVNGMAAFFLMKNYNTDKPEEKCEVRSVWARLVSLIK